MNCLFRLKFRSLERFRQRPAGEERPEEHEGPLRLREGRLVRRATDRGEGQRVAEDLRPSADLYMTSPEKNAFSFATMTIGSGAVMEMDRSSHTCFPSNQTRYGTVALSRSLLARLCTNVLLPVRGITESWSPLQRSKNIFLQASGSGSLNCVSTLTSMLASLLY